MSHFVILDTETTDLNEQGDAQIVGFACTFLHDFVQESEDFYEGHFKPRAPKRIAFEAMATHHITHDMLEDKEYFDESGVLKRLRAEIADGSIVVAHNAKFDIGVLANYGLEIPKNQIIDTMRLAKHVYGENDEISSWSLQYLRYALGINKDLVDMVGDVSHMTAHDAGFDVICTHLLFLHLVGKVMSGRSGSTTTTMLQLTNQPVKVKKLNFGKHKGKHVSQLPYIDKPYLQWLANNADDEDLRYTAKLHLR